MNIEVFSCSGGMAEGLRRAGIPVHMAFDFDTDACDSYEANLGHRPIQIDARDLLRMLCGFTSGIDLLVVDPPCTPWSRAGKRLGQADERDMLSVTVELIRTLRPKAWLFANVPGLDDGPNWPTVQREIGGLCTRDGYCIDFARLDSADYGVPQHRVRPFWYGHRQGRCLEWPERTHASPEACGATLPGITQPRKPWVTCRQALSHLSPEDLGSPIRLRWRGGEGVSKAPRATHVDEPGGVVTANRNNGNGGILFDGPNHRPSRADAPARTLTRNTHGDGALLVNDKHRANGLDVPSRTIRGGGDGHSAPHALLVNDKHPINRADEPSFVVSTKGDGRGAQGACVVEWPWDSPSTVLTTDPNGRIGPPRHHGKSFLSSPNAIKLSEKAAAILQGFPEGWHFCGKTKRSRWSQIGQAIPPPLAEAVGRSIALALAKSTEAA